MSIVIEHLEKILSDLIGNRGRLVEEIGVQKQQLDVNETRVQHFDTLIASVRHSLGTSDAVEKIEKLRVADEPAPPAGQPLPLGSGAGAPPAPSPAPEDGANGATA